MAVQNSFAPNEWYHCYSRGLDKQTIFKNDRDYERFLQLLYLTNSERPIHRSNLRTSSTPEILQIPRASPITAIGVFCLMPNHFHLLLKEIREDGISNFMQRLGTAYTMYFNIKYKRAGSLLTTPFRSRHVKDDRYLQRVIQYIHCNPAELYESQWKEGVVKNPRLLQKRLLDYPYASFRAFTDNNALLRPILNEAVFEVETQLPSRQMIEEAKMYYAECGKAAP
jgi:putative transposase